ncbi:MAG: HAD family hydrolase [Clostridia bacterium]
MQRNLVFFDIDGTICLYGRDPEADIYEAFRLLKAKGNIPYLCTGRGQADIHRSILDLGFEGVISAMGADIWISGELIRHRYLPRNFLTETASALIKNNIAAMLVGQWDVLRTERMEPTSLETRVLHSIEDVFYGNAFSHISSIDLEYGRIDEIASCMPAIRKHSVLVKYSPQSGQTRLLGVSKSSAIEYVRALPQYYGMKAYAIGDSQNDIDMLQHADIGIAMGNAPAELLRIADYVTDRLEDHGLFNALTRFDLI